MYADSNVRHLALGAVFSMGMLCAFRRIIELMLMSADAIVGSVILRCVADSIDGINCTMALDCDVNHVTKYSSDSNVKIVLGSVMSRIISLGSNALTGSDSSLAPIAVANIVKTSRRVRLLGVIRLVTLFLSGSGTCRLGRRRMSCTACCPSEISSARYLRLHISSPAMV